MRGTGDELRIRLGGQEFAFPAGKEILVGRDPAADVVSSNRYVSHKHAKITFINGNWVIEDVGSRRGVHHRGAPVSRLAITGETEVWLGQPNLGDRLELIPRAAEPAGRKPSQPRSTRRTVATAAAVVVLIALGATAIIVATRDGAPAVVDIGDVSLTPAAEGATPDLIESVAPLPSAEPPTGEPTEASGISIDYTLGADDLAGFVDAYRTAFPSADGDEGTIAAGARLCTYLMRHAGPDGAVDLEDALAEANLHEPGFPRDDWIVAFQAASRYYCGEFVVDFEEGPR